MSNTVAQDLQLDALKFVQKGVLDQLAILRQTRGQREVGNVKVPSHLASPDVVRLTAPSGDPRVCQSCGNGLRSGDVRICARCTADPTTDAGVESRHDRASILPAV